MKTLRELCNYAQSIASVMVGSDPLPEQPPLYITEFVTTAPIAESIADAAGACGLMALPYPVENDGALPKLARYAVFTHDMIPRSLWRAYAFTRLVSVHIR